MREEEEKRKRDQTEASDQDTGEARQRDTHRQAAGRRWSIRSRRDTSLPPSSTSKRTTRSWRSISSMPRLSSTVSSPTNASFESGSGHGARKTWRRQELSCRSSPVSAGATRVRSEDGTEREGSRGPLWRQPARAAVLVVAMRLHLHVTSRTVRRHSNISIHRSDGAHQTPPNWRHRGSKQVVCPSTNHTRGRGPPNYSTTTSSASRGPPRPPTNPRRWHTSFQRR